MKVNWSENLDDELKTELEEYDAKMDAEIEAIRNSKDLKHKKADNTFMFLMLSVIIIGVCVCFFMML